MKQDCFLSLMVVGFGFFFDYVIVCFPFLCFIHIVFENFFLSVSNCRQRYSQYDQDIKFLSENLMSDLLSRMQHKLSELTAEDFYLIRVRMELMMNDLKVARDSVPFCCILCPLTPV